MASTSEPSRSKWVVFQDVLISVSLPGVLVDSQWQTFLADLSTAPVTKYLVGSVGSVQSTSGSRLPG